MTPNLIENKQIIYKKKKELSFRLKIKFPWASPELHLIFLFLSPRLLNFDDHTLYQIFDTIPENR